MPYYISSIIIISRIYSISVAGALVVVDEVEVDFEPAQIYEAVKLIAEALPKLADVSTAIAILPSIIPYLLFIEDHI
jgi:hypothetical protein